MDFDIYDGFWAAVIVGLVIAARAGMALPELLYQVMLMCLGLAMLGVILLGLLWADTLRQLQEGSGCPKTVL